MVHNFQEKGFKMNWKDTTTYRQSERGKIEPRCWSLEGRLLRITITNAHIFAPGKWVMHCFALGIDTHVTLAKTKERAQAYAVRYVKEKLNKMMEELE